MNAKEANRLTWDAINERVPEDYKSIQKKIEKAVSKGKFRITYSKNFNKAAFLKLKELLLEDGYRALLEYNNSEYSGCLEIRW